MFPFHRPRRLRKNESVRSLLRENHLMPYDFLVPLFIVEGEGVKEEIPGMPNYFRFSLDYVKQEVSELFDLGIRAVLLFVKVPDNLKDNQGTEALNENGLMQRAIREVKRVQPEMLVFTDVALDPYSEFGHDGIVEQEQILNDETNEVLAQMAVSHALAGADFVAPSDMMDGRIHFIREALENEGLKDVGIMSYTAKYASAFYGPFRNALDSAPGFGDKKTYQMDFANSDEALREAEEDIQEGADILMVKPGLPYLDIIQKIKTNYNVPIAAYQVSGEYAMIKAGIQHHQLPEKEIILESLMAFKRAGASLIATYFAREACEYLNG